MECVTLDSYRCRMAKTDIAPPVALRALIKQAGKSHSDVARELGYKSSSGFQRYIDPNEFSDGLPIELVVKLGVLLAENGDPPVKFEDVLALARVGQSEIDKVIKSILYSDQEPIAEQSGVGEANADGFQPVSIPLEKKLPVYNAAEGGPDGMLVTPEPVSWIVKPQSVANVTDAFAVYVYGESMYPRIEHGEMVVVNPQRPVQKDKDTIFVRVLDDGTWLALVKRLLRWSDKVWYVREYGPEERDFELVKSEWPKAYRVTGRDDG